MKNNPEIVNMITPMHINSRRNVKFRINKYDQLSIVNYANNQSFTVAPGEFIWSALTIADANGNHHIQNGSWRKDVPECSKNLATRPMSYDEFHMYFYEPVMRTLNDKFTFTSNDDKFISDTVTCNALSYENPNLYADFGSNIVAINLNGIKSITSNNRVTYDLNRRAIVVFGLNALPRIILGTSIMPQPCKKSKNISWCSDWYYFQAMNNNMNPNGNILLSDAYFFANGMPVHGTENEHENFGGIYVVPLTLYNLRRLMMEISGVSPETCLFTDELHVMYTA